MPVQVTIYHNVSPDASFGLNAVFITADKAPTVGKLNDGRVYWRHRAQADERHQLVKVFEYQAVPAETRAILDDAFEQFNVGEVGIAVLYRARRLRSLSVGDVVKIGDQAYTCESAGWAEVRPEALRIIDGDEAERVIRKRFEYGPREQLAVTVPLAS